MFWGQDPERVGRWEWNDPLWSQWRKNFGIVIDFCCKLFQSHYDNRSDQDKTFLITTLGGCYCGPSSGDCKGTQVKLACSSRAPSTNFGGVDERPIQADCGRHEEGSEVTKRSGLSFSMNYSMNYSMPRGKTQRSHFEKSTYLKSSWQKPKVMTETMKESNGWLWKAIKQTSRSHLNKQWFSLSQLFARVAQLALRGKLAVFG